MMKQKLTMLFGAILLTSILAFSFYGMGSSYASGKSDHDEHRYTSVQQNPLYQEECGSCHMAYPAQLLPAGSWRKMMQGLDNHFGENAEVDAATSEAIEAYLVQTSKRGSYRKMLRNIGDRLPLRITELPYFRHEHDEIPSKLVKGNDKVSSFSQCNACHQKAERGQFDEDNVNIPGFGRWHD